MSRTTGISELLGRWHDLDRDYLVDGGAAVTYAGVSRAAESNAGALRALGFEGRTVALATENSIATVVAYWSLACAGTTIFLTDARAPAAERRRLLEQAGCRWLAGTPGWLRRQPRTGLVSPGILSISPTGVEVIQPPPAATGPGGEPQGAPGAESAADLAVLVPTSGTTGTPKLVMWAHSGLLANCGAHAEVLGLRREDVALVILCLHYSAAHTTQLLSHTGLGGTLVLDRQPLFSPRRFCQLVERHRVSITSLVPPMLSLLAAYRGLERHDLSSLRLLTVGGASSPAGVVEALGARLPNTGFVHVYGLTEAGPRVSALEPSQVHRFPSVGRPLPGVEVAIFDHHHRDLPAGGVGELRIRGAGVTPGYYRSDEDTARLFHDGWLRTGDLGYRDAEGYLYLTGRSKNIIISGGVNISPEEVETVLSDHPGIRDVVIRREHDERLGEVPVADVVARGDGLSLEDLHGFLSSRLSRPKWPRRLYLRDQLPRTQQGKLRRVSGGQQAL